MKITRYRFWKQNLELTRPYTIAFKTTDSVENIFFEVELSNGKTGLGCCNVSAQVVGVTLEDCWNFFNNEDLDWLVGKNITELGTLLFELSRRYAANPGVLAAMDIALHDAFGNYLDVALVNYLGRAIESLPTSITIGIKNVEETVKEGMEYKSMGFTNLKVKLGHSLEEDIERLIKLNEKLPEMVVRVDANQGYSIQELKAFMSRTKELEIELVEQPLPVEKISDQKDLSAEEISLLAADESLVNSQSIPALLSPDKLFGIFNIKLMKAGGIYESQKIGVAAGVHGIPLMWGCNDESITSISAALAVAYSYPWTKYIDLDGSFDLAKDVVKGGFILKEGRMFPVEKPGLGITRL